MNSTVHIRSSNRTGIKCSKLIYYVYYHGNERVSRKGLALFTVKINLLTYRFIEKHLIQIHMVPS